MTPFRQIDQQIIDMVLAGRTDEAQAVSFLDEAIAAELGKPFNERNECRVIRLKWVREFIREKAA